MISELQERFTDNATHGTGLLHLVPSQCSSSDSDGEIPEDLTKDVDFYNDDLPHPAMFPTEYRMWVRKWKSESSAVSPKLVEALQACDRWTFPNIRVLLHIALTIPVTSCESERSFSQLKLLKSYCRSTMSAHRLRGPAHMKINRLHKSKSELTKLVQEFGKLHPRRMKQPFLLGE